jgi:DNA-binding LacI/PurR family transcriptional regulator
VAAAAGVSQSAVSRAFTPGASIAVKTKVAVLAASKALGYRPNMLARALMTRSTRIVAVVMANLGSPFFSAFLGVLNGRLKAMGLQMMLILVDRARVAEGLDEALEYRVDGIIFVSTTPPAAAIDRAVRAGARVVVMDAFDPGPPASWVWVDAPAIGRLAADAFIEEGRRRPALISCYIDRPDPPEHAAFVDRFASLGQTMVALAKAESSYPGGEAAAAEILGGSDGPDCVFALTDALALGFLGAARLDLGVDVPGRCSLIGIGDVPEAGWRSHALSTINLPIDRLSQAAVSILVEGLRDPAAPRATRTLVCDLVRRSTTRPVGFARQARLRALRHG